MQEDEEWARLVNEDLNSDFDLNDDTDGATTASNSDDSFTDDTRSRSDDPNDPQSFNSIFQSFFINGFGASDMEEEQKV